MANNLNPIPEAYRGATPYLSGRDATDAIKFYKRAFGAREVMQLLQPDGKVSHAELRIRYFVTGTSRFRNLKLES